MALEGPGYRVDIDVLADAVKAMGEISRKQEDIELDDLHGPREMYGHDELRGAFVEFCDAYQTATEVLCDKIDDMRDGLASVVSTYRDAEQTNRTGFGDPALTTVEND